MEDLGDASERFVEFFRCVEKKSTSVSPAPSPRVPPDHGNLLAASSKYGFLFVAVGNQIVVHSLQKLRDDAPVNKPEAQLDLSKHHISTVKAISLVLDDNALSIHAVPLGSEHGCVLLLSTPALVNGNAALLPSPPPQEFLNAVAVRPQVFASDSQTEPTPQLLALLYRQSTIHLYVTQAESEDQEALCSLEHSLSVPDSVTCIALSPDEDLLAVGSTRGSVGLYSTGRASLLTTIVEVESGWRPFSLHFLTSEAVMISYARGEYTSHVIWNLFMNEDGLNVMGHSPLGELCFASPPTPPSSEDGDANDESQFESKPPVIWCSRIPGWDICVVASSMSTDVELISLNDDGIWENWNFDEGQSATLPTDENDKDTVPIGVALDLTDTSSIESPEPAAPRINPMPRLLTFTSDSILLPFVLIDDRPDATCKFIRGSQSLPQVPSNARSLGPIVFQDSKSRSEAARPESSDSASSDVKAGPPSIRDSPTDELHEAASFPSIVEPLARAMPDFSSSAGFSTGQTSYVESSYPPTGIMPSRVDAFGKTRKRGALSSSSRDSPSPDNSITDEKQLEGTITDSVNDVLEAAPDSQPLFSGQDQFLSVFERTGITDDEHGRGATLGKLTAPFAFPLEDRSASGRVVKSTLAPAGTNKASTVRTPTLPPPPSLAEANAALLSGKPRDLIKSTLLEMAEELNNNREVERATIQTLRETNNVVLPLAKSVKSGVAEVLQILRDRFRDEGSLRREVLGSLRTMMMLSREYESASLEFRLREEEGFASHVQAEDKAMDDKIAKKESEILRSLSGIEARLTANRGPKERRFSQSDQIQQIYSSLSLQGIRVKKIHGLLSALSQRIDGLDRGGRRSDLGLSMARLEKLSICTNVTAGNGSNMPQAPASEADDIMLRNKPQKLAEANNNGDGTLISNDVKKVLRRLAMRNGRADINRTGPLKHYCDSTATAREQADNIDHSGNLLLNRQSNGDNSVQLSLHSNRDQMGTGRQEMNSFSFGTVKKPSRPFASSSRRDLSKRNETKPVDSAFFSPSKRSPSEFAKTGLEPKKRWSKTFANDSASVSVRTSPHVVEAPPPVPPGTSSSKSLFASLPPDDFIVSEKRFTPSQSAEQSFTFAKRGDEWYPREKSARTTNSTPNVFGYPRPIQPSPVFVGKKRISGEDSVPSDTAADESVQTPTTDAKSPRSYSTMNNTASLPVKASISEARSLDGNLDFKSSPGVEKGNVPFAVLPPGTTEKDSINDSLAKNKGKNTLSRPDVKKSSLFAALPPDSEGKDKESVSVPNLTIRSAATLPPDTGLNNNIVSPSTGGAIRDTTFAVLPPDDDLHEESHAQGQAVKDDTYASLPPDDDLKETVLHPQGEAVKGSTFASLPPDDDLKGSLFATLPPEEDIKSAPAKESPANPLDTATNQGDGETNVKGAAAEASSSDMSTSVNLFGEKASIGRGEGGDLIFGAKVSSGETRAQEGTNASSLFGSGSQGGTPQLRAGAEVVPKPGEASDVRDSTSDIQADSSDSDMDNNDTRGFRMASETPSSNSQSAFAGFGSPFQSGQGVGASLFSQSNSNPFGNTGGAFGHFSSSPASAAQGMGFGSASAYGSGGTQPVSAAASSPSFASPSPFGTVAQFGATSTLGSSTSFGNGASGIGGSQIGATAQFGASSQLGSSGLGAGFGMQSPLGGGASPFAQQDGTTATGFGSGTPGFGGGMPTAKFGESSFGNPNQSPFGGSTGGSPFAAVAAPTNAMFGGQVTGSSGFAALAASQPFGVASSGSGFGSGMTPVFGSNAGPPSFTSAAFSQRRA